MAAHDSADMLFISSLGIPFTYLDKDTSRSLAKH